jgi:hypothetical protein
LLGPRFTDNDGSPLELGAVKSGCGLLGFFIGPHLNKTKPFGPAAEFVRDNPGAYDRAVLGKQLLELVLRYRVSKIAHI